VTVVAIPRPLDKKSSDPPISLPIARVNGVVHEPEFDIQVNVAEEAVSVDPGVGVSIVAGVGVPQLPELPAAM